MAATILTVSILGLITVFWFIRRRRGRRVVDYMLDTSSAQPVITLVRRDGRVERYLQLKTGWYLVQSGARCPARHQGTLDRLALVATQEQKEASRRT